MERARRCANNVLYTYFNYLIELRTGIGTQKSSKTRLIPEKPRYEDFLRQLCAPISVIARLTDPQLKRPFARK